MTDYISRADAIEAVQKIVPYVIDKDIGQWGILVNKANVITELSAVPSADAVHGEWVCKEREYNDCDGHYAYYWYECSVCGARPPKDTFKNEWHSDYCPSCGARMKGGAE